MPGVEEVIRLTEKPTTVEELWQLLSGLMNGARSITEFMPSDIDDRIYWSRWIYVISLDGLGEGELEGFIKTLEGIGHNIANYPSASVYEVFAGFIYNNGREYALYHIFEVDEEEEVLYYYDELYTI